MQTSSALAYNNDDTHSKHLSRCQTVRLAITHPHQGMQRVAIHLSTSRKDKAEWSPVGYSGRG